MANEERPKIRLQDVERIAKTLSSVPKQSNREVTKLEAVRMLMSPIEVLQAGGYNVGEIASLLTENGLPITKVALREYLRSDREGKGEDGKAKRKGKGVGRRGKRDQPPAAAQVAAAPTTPEMRCASDGVSLDLWDSFLTSNAAKEAGPRSETRVGPADRPEAVEDQSEWPDDDGPWADGAHPVDNDARADGDDEGLGDLEEWSEVPADAPSEEDGIDGDENGVGGDETDAQGPDAREGQATNERATEVAR